MTTENMLDLSEYDDIYSVYGAPLDDLKERVDCKDPHLIKEVHEEKDVIGKLNDHIIKEDIGKVTNVVPCDQSEPETRKFNKLKRKESPNNEENDIQAFVAARDKKLK